MERAEEVLSFWLDEVGPKGWYAVDAELDQQVRDRFGDLYQQAVDGAYIILMDQFPRNMFRDSGAAFQTDAVALAAAKAAIDRKWDLKIDAPARQFFYLPLMHSENLCDQDRCVRLMHERMPEQGADNLLHAKAHRQVIRKFGRFPYRNAALERPTTAVEQAYVEAGGYGKTVRELQAG